jgi:hypothetical protein
VTATAAQLCAVAGLITTAVREPLCGSTPIITAAMTSPSARTDDRGGHALFQNLLAARLF